MNPNRIGTHRQLFVDDVIIGEMSEFTRRIQPAVKYPGNPVLSPTLPWEGNWCLLYGSVIRDAATGLWRMWYLTLNQLGSPPPEENSYVCYAESTDGLRWEKPRLGVHAYRGRTDNNIVVKNHFAHVPNPRLDAMCVIETPHDPDPRRRYKMLMWHHGHWDRNAPAWRAGHYAYFSADGIHWHERPEQPVFGPAMDTHDTMSTFWDTLRRKYVAFVKQHVDETGAHVPFKPGPSGVWRRSRAQSESDDFLNWTDPKLILVPKPNDPLDVQYYHNNAFVYEGLYLGFLTCYHVKEGHTLDTRLIASRNGTDWSVVSEEPILPVGPAHASFDCGWVDIANNPPFRVGNELRIYYGGRNGDHHTKGLGAIGIATLRLDGFVALEAGDKKALLRTRPFVFEGDALFVNADASQGELTVHVLDETGEPLGSASDPIREDRVDHLVTWGGKSKLAAVKGRRVALLVEARRSRLFSFRSGADPLAAP